MPINTRHYQHYALIEDGSLIEVSNTHKDDGHVYRCPYCKQEMIAKRGQQKAWHFAHKVDNPEECSYDQYLHTLAKRRFLEWYQNANDVSVDISTNYTCESSASCPFYEGDCGGETLRHFSLKSFYPIAELEKDFETPSGVFRADILLSSPNYPNDPVFVEICVKHPCSEEKKNSGLRIIEIKINSEEDIDKFLNDHHRISILEEHTYFYGFRVRPVIKDNCRKELQKFVIQDATGLGILGTNCRSYQKHIGALEITTLVGSFSNLMSLQEFFLSRAYQLGLIQKECRICAKFSKCYKRDESKCEQFQPNSDLINCSLQDYDQFAWSHHCDIWVNKIIDNQNLQL